MYAKARTGLDRYDGPYVITVSHGGGESYVIEDDEGKSKKRRAEELKLFVPRSDDFTGGRSAKDNSGVPGRSVSEMFCPQWDFTSPFFGSDWSGSQVTKVASVPTSPSTPVALNSTSSGLVRSGARGGSLSGGCYTI